MDVEVASGLGFCIELFDWFERSGHNFVFRILMVRDAGEQDGCTVSNPAKISGKLPDNGSHETLPAKAFLITEVTAKFGPAAISWVESAIQLPAQRKSRIGILGENRNTSDPALNVTQQTALFVYRRLNFNGPKCVSLSD